jgi:hypothetical protein
MKSGMKYLIESFYQSIVQNTPPPIPYRDILLTAHIMDMIFEQLQSRRPASCEAGLEPLAGRRPDAG